MTPRVRAVTGQKCSVITRELLDCFRRDIHSGHPVFSSRAIEALKECLERGGSFDCEATRLNAVDLFSATTARG